MVQSRRLSASVFVLVIAGTIVTAGTPTQLALSGNVSPVAGTCAAVQVIAEDSSGHPAPVASDTSVALVGQVVGFLFTGIFSDATCKQHSVNVLLPAGSTTGTFYFSDNLAQQVTLTVSASSLTSGTLVVNVAPAPPSKLALTGFYHVITTGCSAAFTISTIDGFRNPSPVTQPVPISLSGNRSGTLYSDVACRNAVTTVTLAAGSASIPVYLRDGTPEVLTLQASTTNFGSASRLVGVTAPAGPPASSAGAGKVAYTCPAGATVIPPPQNGVDNLSPAVANSTAGQTLCIQGEHRIAAPLSPKTNQTWIGIGTNARISGAVQLTGWQPYSPGAWTYTGPYSTQMNTLVDFAIGIPSCYTVSIYQDDLFYRSAGGANDQRVMRVLSLGELTGALTTPGQAETVGEDQRFFFDYGGTVSGSPAIYISFDPTKSIVDLPIIQTVIAGQSITGVTMENLFIEKALNTVVTAGRSWTLTDATVRFAHNAGLIAAPGTQSAPFVINRVFITSNGQYGMTAGSWTTIENSDLSWGNIANYRKQITVDSNCAGYFAAGGMKVIHAQGLSASVPGLTISNTLMHHNIGHGGWDDVGSQYLTIQGNHIYNNEGAGYFHEIGCEIDFRGNELNGNGSPIKNATLGLAALLVNDSNNGTFTGNTIHGNVNGAITLFQQATHLDMLANPCLGASSAGDTSNSLKNNVVQSNSVYTCSLSASAGQTDSNLQTAIARNNQFISNTYHMIDSTGAFWTDPFGVTWSQWQADQQDLQGTLIVGCTYP